MFADAMRPSDGATLDVSALTNLKTLELSGCSLQDADLVSLAGLCHLEWLILDGTFTEKGLWHLSKLPELKHLTVKPAPLYFFHIWYCFDDHTGAGYDRASKPQTLLWHVIYGCKKAIVSLSAERKDLGWLS